MKDAERIESAQISAPSPNTTDKPKESPNTTKQQQEHGEKNNKIQPETKTRTPQTKRKREGSKDGTTTTKLDQTKKDNNTTTNETTINKETKKPRRLSVLELIRKHN